ncbi:ATP-binding protein [Halovivax gelatinilyticus]|uniref:ATP-binding protein n=1 Tax=Halovivax gelatinilyticus TaxID=2961597 RepID=UPI0020CA49B1|nr:ATP-binding protein [Halovivax gelatinilyticus]
MAQVELTNRVTRLGEIAADMEDCESADDLFEFTVSAATRVIEFDAAIVCTLESDQFRPKAAYSTRLVPGDLLSAGDGIAGATFRAGHSIRVDDVRSDERAAPSADHIRSVLSTPFAERGVLQLHSTRVGAFDDVDVAFAELLVATVTNALGRVRYERALGEERDQFAALFENVPDAALAYRVTNGTKIIDSVNSSFVGVFDTYGEEVVGRPVDSIVGVPDELAHSDQSVPVEPNRRTDAEVVRETPDGPRPFLLRNVPIRTDDDSTRGYLIYTDLTTLKERERELEQKNERLDQFASMVSHDLRNPLNVAAGYLELAKEENHCEELEAIERAHRRMGRLIEDVLSLARDGGSVDSPQPVHLGTVVREAWDHVSTDGGTLRVDGDVIERADPNRLLQMFENLFRNAVEHGSTSRAEPDDSADAIEHAGPDVTVRVEATSDGFAISDDGPGIDREVRERIFESGYTTTCENTGLGLAIVDQIVEAHGWEITVSESEQGGMRIDVWTGRDESAFGSGEPRG